MIKNINNVQKKLFLIFSDFIIICLSVFLAYSIRLEKLFNIFEIDIKIFLIFLSVFFAIFYFQNIYQILIRYFDYHSVIKIFKSILLSFIILVPINLTLYEYIYFPRSISFITSVIFGILIVLHRILLNFLLNIGQKNSKIQNNILIFGIDQNNVNLISSIRNSNDYGSIRGLIDTSGKYKKRELNGIKIFKIQNLNHIIKKYSITELIIGYNSITKLKLKKIYDEFRDKNIRIRSLPRSNSDSGNFINRSFEKEIDFFDIVDRPKILVENKILKNKITDKVILVTGGGGSIGSELCLEIVKHKPKKLFILDISEINLFNIIKKINHKNLKYIKPILGDCSDPILLKKTFKQIKIDEIFHVAAYKHVNFGENNSYSMIKNNIYGTNQILKFASAKKIQNFTFISSDKAVNPKSILGYSKKIGENLVHEFYQKSKLKKSLSYTVVRFGNVIGSSGSVIPIFIDQIKNNKSLTVTSKKSERYFMSISEAVQLIINSSFLNTKEFSIYSLNMGKQIKIYEIAKRIIRLSGYNIKNKSNPYGDFKIEIIGLKKGEKISEELSLGTKLEPTSHTEIMKCNDKIYSTQIIKKLKSLEKKIIESKSFQMKLKKLIY